MYYVYVIRNEEGRTYTGYTGDLRRRMEEHNHGRNRSTKDHSWKLIYYEAFRSSSDARRRERRLKRSHQARRWLRERISDSLEMIGEAECRKSFELKPQ